MVFWNIFPCTKLPFDWKKHENSKEKFEKDNNNKPGVDDDTV